MPRSIDPFPDVDPSASLTAQSDSRHPPLMAIDADGDGDRVVVHIDLPGVDADSIEITVENHVRTVRAHRSWSETEGRAVLIAERPAGTFTRQLFLGDSLDLDAIEANYDNGVLTLVIAVAAPAEAHTISVKTGDNGHLLETRPAGE